MENDIFNNLFLLFVLAMVVVGAVSTMNYLERIIGRFFRERINKFLARRRYRQNMKLIDKRMNKFNGFMGE